MNDFLDQADDQFDHLPFHLGEHFFAQGRQVLEGLLKGFQERSQFLAGFGLAFFKPLGVAFFPAFLLRPGADLEGLGFGFVESVPHDLLDAFPGFADVFLVQVAGLVAVVEEHPAPRGILGHQFIQLERAHSGRFGDRGLFFAFFAGEITGHEGLGSLRQVLLLRLRRSRVCLLPPTVCTRRRFFAAPFPLR